MTTFEETKKLLENSNFYYIITTNMQGKYSYINKNYDKTFSHIHGSVVGQPYHVTMHEDDTKICQEVAVKCFANPDKVFPATIRKHDGKGGYVVTQWEYKAMFDENNNPLGIFCLGYDVTDYMHTSERLEDANDVIERKNVVLREIAFNQSHIIRRPLANILGIGLILEKMEMDQNMRNLCNMLIESSKQLDDVIKDIVGKTYL